MSMREASDGLYEIIRLLLPHNQTARIKKAALYLTIVDQDGAATRITFDDELVIYPYKAAADHYRAGLPAASSQPTPPAKDFR